MNKTKNTDPQATSILRVVVVFVFCAVMLNSYVATAQTFAQAESNGGGTGAFASASSSGGGAVAAFAQSNGDGTGTVVIIGQPNGNVAAQAQIEVMRDGLRERFGLTFTDEDGFQIFGNIPLDMAVRDFRVLLPEMYVLGNNFELSYVFDLAHFVMREIWVE